MSSSTRMNRKRIRICGRNTSTLPAPAMTPSTSRLLSAPSGSRPVTSAPSHETPESIRPIGSVAQLNTAWNTKKSSTARITGPASGCMTSASRRRGRGPGRARCSRRPRGCGVLRAGSAGCGRSSGRATRAAARRPDGSPPRGPRPARSCPPPATATVSTTGTPSSRSSLSRSRRKPRSRARSLMLSATIIGTPRSRNSSTSRRLRRRLVASTTQTTNSGAASPASRPSRKSRVIASSSVVGVRL